MKYILRIKRCATDQYEVVSGLFIYFSSAHSADKSLYKQV